MAQKFLFIRHGRTQDDRVTVHGWLDLAHIRDQLIALGFNGVHAMSSTENRCIETAFFLSNGVPVNTRAVLHAYGDMTQVGVVNPSASPTWHTAIAWGLKAMTQIITALNSKEGEVGDVVVCGHDFMPIILAQQFIKLNGGNLDWESVGVAHPMFPNQGEGILVEGTDYHILRNA